MHFFGHSQKKQKKKQLAASIFLRKLVKLKIVSQTIAIRLQGTAAHYFTIPNYAASSKDITPHI